MVILGMAAIIGGVSFLMFLWMERSRRNRRTMNRRTNALVHIPPRVRTWPDVE